jgi:hypothetical protein
MGSHRIHMYPQRAEELCEGIICNGVGRDKGNERKKNTRTNKMRKLSPPLG